MFFANGVIVGAWASAIPGFSERLGLDERRLSVVLLTFALGGIVMMALTPPLVRRFGAGRVAFVMGAGFVLSFLLPMLAPGWWWAVAGAGVFGLTHGSMDIAMNADAVDLESGRERPILSRMHGCFSVGASVGAVYGGVLAQIGPAPAVHGLLSEVMERMVEREARRRDVRLDTRRPVL